MVIRQYFHKYQSNFLYKLKLKVTKENNYDEILLLQEPYTGKSLHFPYWAACFSLCKPQLKVVLKLEEKGGCKYSLKTQKNSSFSLPKLEFTNERSNKGCLCSSRQQHGGEGLWVMLVAEVPSQLGTPFQRLLEPFVFSFCRRVGTR